MLVDLGGSLDSTMALHDCFIYGSSNRIYLDALHRTARQHGVYG